MNGCFIFFKKSTKNKEKCPKIRIYSGFSDKMWPDCPKREEKG